jgi:hypothetical protein
MLGVFAQFTRLFGLIASCQFKDRHVNWNSIFQLIIATLQKVIYE